MPAIAGFYIWCSYQVFALIIYTPAPLRRTSGDWRADPYLCGLTEVPTRHLRPAPIMRRFDIVAPVIDQDCPF